MICKNLHLLADFMSMKEKNKQTNKDDKIVLQKKCCYKQDKSSFTI